MQHAGALADPNAPVEGWRAVVQVLVRFALGERERSRRRRELVAALDLPAEDGTQEDAMEEDGQGELGRVDGLVEGARKPGGVRRSLCVAGRC